MAAALRFLIVVFLLVAAGEQAVAGWYRVDNYEGEVGGRSIQLSLQRYDFGSGITLEGSYYFEAERRPVPIYGTISGGRAVLCEISSDAELNRIVVQGSKTPFDFTNCPLTLTLAEHGVSGNWKWRGVDNPVVLKRVAGLDDTTEQLVTGHFVVPFWAQTDTHMFAGVYTSTASGVCMTKVEIIEKANGKVDQMLTYGGDVCTAGMVMTPIYMNVQEWIEDGVEVMSVNFRDTAAGYSEDFIYDRDAKKYLKRD